MPPSAPMPERACGPAAGAAEGLQAGRDHPSHLRSGACPSTPPNARVPPEQSPGASVIGHEREERGEEAVGVPLGADGAGDQASVEGEHHGGDADRPPAIASWGASEGRCSEPPSGLSSPRLTHRVESGVGEVGSAPCMCLVRHLHGCRPAGRDRRHDSQPVPAVRRAAPPAGATAASSRAGRGPIRRPRRGGGRRPRGPARYCRRVRPPRGAAAARPEPGPDRASAAGPAPPMGVSARSVVCPRRPGRTPRGGLTGRYRPCMSATRVVPGVALLRPDRSRGRR